ncbi:AAA family ATPase [Actinoplanes sp. NPDC049802]|uniref:AAA family ATPase n=1 Tax=Actinoplanes sp. NPDC049802 TaxID=3154742 RepID=UPI003411B64C
MPFAPARLVLAAADAIDGTHALAAVTLPALLREGVRQGVDVTVDQVAFGLANERELLNDYFRLPRPPESDRPYRAIWSTSTVGWQTEKFPGGGLQRQRTGVAAKGEVLIQRKPAQTGLDHDVWGLTPTAGADLRKRSEAVRVVDLALWMGREIDTAAIGPSALAVLPPTADDLDTLVAWFIAEFQPDRGDLIGTILDATVPAEYRMVPFSPDPIDDGTAIELGSLPPVNAVAGTLAQRVADLERRIIANGYELPPGLVRRVLSAWLRGDMVVLVGQPGTGKSLFARLLANAMEAEFGLDSHLVIPIRNDFDEAEFIGYERLDGEAHLQNFAREILQTENPLDARVVILEEFNLAAAETYMSAVLVASQEQDRNVRLPNGDIAQMPVDTFIIATCNSFRDEPETRTRVSSPTKRRSTTITMPNVLGDRYEDDEENAVLGLVERLIDNARTMVDGRATTDRAVQFDPLRAAALNSIRTLDDISAAARTALVEICHSILATGPGRSWFTLGLLRDVVLAVAIAERDQASELEALGQAVADKLVHQVRGGHNDVTGLLAAIAELPNAEEIGRLVEQAMAGPADELLPLL